MHCATVCVHVHVDQCVCVCHHERVHTNVCALNCTQTKKCCFRFGSEWYGRALVDRMKGQGGQLV